jgi:hypothetical protein
VDDGTPTRCTPLAPADVEAKVEAEAASAMPFHLAVSCGRTREQPLPPSKLRMEIIRAPSRGYMTMSCHACCLFWI